MKKSAFLNFCAVLAAFVTTSAYSAPISKKFKSSSTKELVLRMPKVQSAAALAVDFTNNKILFERQADDVRPIASLSKLMAALVIHNECDLDPTGFHEMTKENRQAARGGDKSKFMTGWSYTHKDLMYAALMRSDNRALPALAEACGISTAELGELMTARARDLGLTNTNFVEPTGLSPNNISTAREMMHMLREVLKVPALVDILQTERYSMAGYKGKLKRTVEIRSTDRLLWRRDLDIIGGKTGYTDLARYCFAVGLKLFDNHNIGVVLMGAEGKHTRFADVSRLVHWLKKEWTSVAYADGGKSKTWEWHPPLNDVINASADAEDSSL